MPYITDKLKLESAFLKKSAKMLPCQKEMAKYWYEKGMSIADVARMFKVSRRAIQFLLFPERKKKNVEDLKARGGSMIYYDKEHHKAYMKTHRKHKHNLLGNKTDKP